VYVQVRDVGVVKRTPGTSIWVTGYALAPGDGIALLGGARIVVVTALDRRAPRALAPRACICLRAGVAVVAGGGIRREDASLDGVVDIIRAGGFRRCNCRLREPGPYRFRVRERCTCRAGSRGTGHRSDSEYRENPCRRRGNSDRLCRSTPRREPSLPRTSPGSRRRSNRQRRDAPRRCRCSRRSSGARGRSRREAGRPAGASRPTEPSGEVSCPSRRPIPPLQPGLRAGAELPELRPRTPERLENARIRDRCPFILIRSPAGGQRHAGLTHSPLLNTPRRQRMQSFRAPASAGSIPGSSSYRTQ
jgi:hypothetical protein